MSGEVIAMLAVVVIVVLGFAVILTGRSSAEEEARRQLRIELEKERLRGQQEKK